MVQRMENGWFLTGQNSVTILHMVELTTAWPTAVLTLEALVESLQRALGDDLIGVVLYGSHARGTPRPDSDVDLLIIAGGLPESRYERAGWFGQVLAQSDYDGPRVSMLGKTPEEFEGHFPSLYLDIGLDGVTLFDRGDYTAGKLARIRELISEAGLVRKTFDGEMQWELTRPVPEPPGYWGIEWDGYHEYPG